MFQLLLPEVDKYFLWSSSAKESLFNFSARKNLRRRVKHSSEDPPVNTWNGVWNILKLNKYKKEALIGIQESLNAAKERLLKSVNEFLNSKNKLWEEAEKISSLIREKALGVFSAKRTVATILWIHDVITILFCGQAMR